MLDQWEEIWYQMAEMRRQAGNTDRFGYVKEVQKDKIRVVYGIKNDGSELLSPWVHTTSQRGTNRERHQFEKGQNVRVSSTAGTFRNGSVSHWAASTSHPAPDHASDVNGYSHQAGKTAAAFNTSGQQQQGGGGTSLLGTTEVLTPDGFKNIQDIQLGDKVLSCPTGSATRKPVEDTVLAIQKALTKNTVYSLNYDGGNLYCTGEHGIWTENSSNYTAADKLGFVDKLRSFDGKPISIVSLVPSEAEQSTVYDLTVENNGNFYARDGSSGSAILVHNQAGGGGGGSSGDYVDHMIFDQASQPPQHQDQTGEMGSFGGGQQQQQGGQQQKKPNAAMKSRLHEKTFITHRVGKNLRVMVSDKEAIIMYGEGGQNTVFCDSDGCHSTKPLTIKKPQSKIDND